MIKTKYPFYSLLLVLVLFAVNFTVNSENEIVPLDIKVTYSSQLDSQVDNNSKLLVENCNQNPTCNCQIWQVVTSPTNCYCMTTDQDNKFVCPSDCCNLEDPGEG